MSRGTSRGTSRTTGESSDHDDGQSARQSGRQPGGAHRVDIKRVYAPPAPGDGQRILVDRIWPRGLTKEAAALALWLKDAAPSTDLRKWFGHDPAKWDEFQRRYRAELDGSPALDELKKLAAQGRLTLVYAARDEQHNNAVVLRDLAANPPEAA